MNRPARRLTLLVLLPFLWAAFSPLFAQTRYPSDGKVVDPARSFLRDHYRADLEQGYCITHWSIQRDSVVIDSVIPSPAILDQGEFHVVFLCPMGTVALHTHPPTFPKVSNTDKMPLLGPSTIPFVVIQWGPEQYDFWIWWARSDPDPAWKGVES